MDQEKVITLLGSGLSPSVVASHLGVSDSAISQLLGNQEIAEKVQELRFAALQKNNSLDESVARVEEKLLKRIEDRIPMLTRPMELMKAYQIINSAVRRGAAAPVSATQQQTVVNLVLPIAVSHKFVTNSNNQVVSTGAQDLITIPARQLESLSNENELLRTRESVPG